MSSTPVNTAKIIFKSDGTPYSEVFDDIYFDHSLSYQQSEQVFIKGNNIPHVWHDFIANKAAGGFVIAETGFGSGLNFLLTLEKFIQFKRHSQSALTLKYISSEKFPLSKTDLQRALALWPEYRVHSDELLGQYDLTKGNCCTMIFADGTVQLDIYFCDATQAFTALKVPTNSNQQGLVDSWYLDGFAPNKNPDMWQPKLFAQVARLAKNRSTLATFTVANIVRQGLEQVGYKIKKHKHNSQKAETLSATMLGIRSGKPLNGFKQRNAQKTEKPKHVSIIGGGLASACSALALAKRGINVQLYCKDKSIAEGASSNAVGAIFPLIHQQPDTISKFYQQGFEHSLKLYQQLLADGFYFSHGFDGLIEVCYKPALVKRQQAFTEKASWPDDFIHAIDAEQVNNIANIEVGHPGLFIPRAGWVSPPELVGAILQAAVATGFCKIKTNRHINKITQLKNDHWLINTNKGQKSVKHLVVCAGADSLDIELLNDLPLSQVRGQVSQMHTNEQIKPLATVLCHKGYLTPQNNNMHCIGATFDKDDNDLTSRPEDDQYNLTMLATCLGDVAGWSITDVAASKARLRCCTPDHLPMVGQLPNIELHKQFYQHLSKDKNWHFSEPAPIYPGLYVLTGLGARGLSCAPLLADILASEICDEVYPVDDEMLFNLAPNRFVIRDLIKRKNEKWC